MPLKSILITGAASGIGRETALLFSRKGWFVGLFDRDEAGLRPAKRVVDDTARSRGHDAAYRVERRADEVDAANPLLAPVRIDLGSEIDLTQKRLKVVGVGGGLPARRRQDADPERDGAELPL